MGFEGEMNLDAVLLKHSHHLCRLARILHVLLHAYVCNFLP